MEIQNNSQNCGTTIFANDWCKMKTLSVTNGKTDWPMDRAGHSRVHATKDAKYWKNFKIEFWKYWFMTGQ